MGRLGTHQKKLKIEPILFATLTEFSEMSVTLIHCRNFVKHSLRNAALYVLVSSQLDAGQMDERVHSCEQESDICPVMKE